MIWVVAWLYVWGVVMVQDALFVSLRFPLDRKNKEEATRGWIIALTWPLSMPAIWVLLQIDKRKARL